MGRNYLNAILGSLGDQLLWPLCTISSVCCRQTEGSYQTQRRRCSVLTLFWVLQHYCVLSCVHVDATRRDWTELKLRVQFSSVQLFHMNGLCNKLRLAATSSTKVQNCELVQPRSSQSNERKVGRCDITLLMFTLASLHCKFKFFLFVNVWFFFSSKCQFHAASSVNSYIAWICRKSKL